MKNQYWTPLEKGDLIDIIAPGMKPKPGTVKKVTGFFASWGLRARMSADLQGRDLICANSQQKRFLDLKRALLAKDSKMVWCLRGGYGSLKLLEALSRQHPIAPKIFMGLSDITSLHTFLNQQWNWPTLHACNAGRFVLGEGSLAEQKRCFDLLFAKKKEVKYGLKPLNEKATKKKVIRSSLVGGNMITLQSSFGTPFQMQTKNKILFFEEIGERAYKIDRVLEHMRQLGLTQKASAIVFGQFTGGEEPGGRSLVPRLLKEFASQQKIPVFYGVQSGHGKNQHPLPLNTSAKIHWEIGPFLQIQSGGKP